MKWPSRDIGQPPHNHNLLFSGLAYLFNPDPDLIHTLAAKTSPVNRAA
jgi:hypothetical protein